MKQLKKFMAIFVVVATAFCAGCSGDASDKVSTDAKASAGSDVAAAEESKGVEAGDTFEGEGFSIVAPKGWKDIGMKIAEGAVSIMKGNDKSMNVMIMEAPAELATITAEDYKAIIESNFEVQEAYGMTLNKAEVQKRPYGDIVYAEVSTKVTQDLIDASMDSGLLTQEAIDAMGGAEAYMKNMSLEQICAYYVKDGKILMVTAQVTGGGSLDAIKDDANFLLDNITLK